MFRPDPELAATAEKHFQYGYQLLGKKQFDQSISQLLYVLSLAPRHRAAHFYVGLAYIEKGLTGLEQAAHHLSRAIEIDPSNPRQFHYRGVVRMRLGAYEDAVSDFRRMLQADPDYYSTLYSLGATLMRLARYREAVEVLRKAVEAEPEKLEPRWNLRLATMLSGDDPNTLPPRHRIELSRVGRGESPVRFSEVARDIGIRRYSRGRGSGWSDLDGDGDLDLFAVGIRDPHALFRNDGKGGFTEATLDAGLLDPNGGWSALLADYDNDGDPDIYVTRDGWDGEAPNSLYRNDRGVFIDVAASAGVEGSLDSFTAAFADIDNDGDLDLYVANGVATQGGSPNQLFRNEGNGTFTEIAAEAGVANHGRSIGCAFGDYDNDGWQDLLVVNFFGHPALYHNEGGERFRDVSRQAGVVLPKEGFVGFFFDYDNDGWQDLFLVGFAGEMEEALRSAVAGRSVNERNRLVLYRNKRDGTFADVTLEAGLARNFGAMAASYGDIDNDGLLDIYLGCGAPAMERFEPNRLFRNRGDGTFVDISSSAGVDNLGKGHGVSLADYDADGDLDIFVPTGGAFLGDRQPDSLYRNEGTPHHWLHVKLTGTRSNRDAVGARVTIRLGDELRMQEIACGGGFGSTNSLELEFGLGPSPRVDELEVRWPSGLRQVLKDLAGDQKILITEGEEGYRLFPF